MSRTELKLVKTVEDDVTRVVPLGGHPSGQEPPVDIPVLRVVSSDGSGTTPDDAA